MQEILLVHKFWTYMLLPPPFYYVLMVKDESMMLMTLGYGGQYG